MTDEPKITLKVKVDNILQMISNKVTTWSNTPSNDNYPSEKLVKDSLDGKANLSHNHDDRYYTESEIDNKIITDVSGLTDNQGLLFSGSYNDLSDKPTIPSASTSTPSADTTSGSVGTGTTWARSNHTHPKSSLYAEASHTHSEYVNPTIIDNLTTDDATKVLSAKQGKILNDMIGSAITYITGSDN